MCSSTMSLYAWSQQPHRLQGAHTLWAPASLCIVINFVRLAPYSCGVLLICLGVAVPKAAAAKAPHFWFVSCPTVILQPTASSACYASCLACMLLALQLSSTPPSFCCHSNLDMDKSSRMHPLKQI